MRAAFLRGNAKAKARRSLPELQLFEIELFSVALRVVSGETSDMPRSREHLDH